MRIAPITLIGLWSIVGVAAAADTNKHMGVSSCAASHCHGRIDKDPTSNVWLNEYRIWRGDDYHSRAYKTLQTAESRLIAAKLGLRSAHESALCLTCHTSNVPPDRRGPEFQVTDGVGCESCHGGAEKWLSSHDDKGVDYKQNVRNGLYPMADPAARARLCLGCHMGSGDRFATHRIMGAGHPRLSFELENFTANQPAHYAVDEDYRRRKGNLESAALWLSGQIEGSLRFLFMLQTKYPQSYQWAPEFAFYDCQSCHHGLDPQDKRWLPQRRNQGLEPGALRLQDHHFRMLEVISDALTPGDSAQLRTLVNEVVKAGQTNREAVLRSAKSLEAWIQAHRAAWLRGTSNGQVRDIRRRLLTQASSGTLVDYGTAEQGLLSIVTLSACLGEQDRVAGAIDDLFNALGNDETFRPGRYAASAKRVAGRF